MLTVDHIAVEIGFLSVGTNDLIQTTFTADRQNGDNIFNAMSAHRTQAESVEKSSKLIKIYAGLEVPKPRDFHLRLCLNYQGLFAAHYEQLLQGSRYQDDPDPALSSIGVGAGVSWAMESIF